MGIIGSIGWPLPQSCNKIVVNASYKPPDHAGRGQVRHEADGNADRAGAGTAAAVRRGERLVQVHVHHVESDVAGADASDDGVEVRAVAVAEAARLVHELADLGHVRVEEAERVRTRQHDARHFGRQHRLQRVQVHVAVRVAGHDLRREPCHGGARRVRAVRGIRDQHVLAGGVAAGAVIGRDQHAAGEFAVGARHGLHGHL